MGRIHHILAAILAGDRLRGRPLEQIRNFEENIFLVILLPSAAAAGDPRAAEM